MSSSLRTPAKTRQPRESSQSAVALPIPVDAPVTSADLTARRLYAGERPGLRSAAVTSTAFVTGGSGFIGGRLIERLVREGTAVRALARSDGSAKTVSDLGAEPVRGDLSDRESLEAGAAGAELAFHLAAHLGDWGDWEDFERGNVDGTENALAATAAAGVRRFVHCGTEAALMAGDPLVHVDEEAPLRPDSRAPYSATKARAELAVRRANRPGSRPSPCGLASSGAGATRRSCRRW